VEALGSYNAMEIKLKKEGENLLL